MLIRMDTKTLRNLIHPRQRYKFKHISPETLPSQMPRIKLFLILPIALLYLAMNSQSLDFFIVFAYHYLG